MLNFLAAVSGNGAGGGGSFESIATATGTGSSGTITFSSIPSTYQHLQLRINGIASIAGGSIRMRFNSDTGSNYAAHYLIGIAPSGTFATGSASGAYIGVTGAYDGVVTTYPNVAIIDIHDYASTTKNKTARIFSGQQNNTTTAGDVELNSGLWLNTSAINSVTVYLSSGNYNSGSTFALYGIKGA